MFFFFISIDPFIHSVALCYSVEQIHSDITKGNLAKVSSNGRVHISSAGKTKTDCSLHMTFFPFDKHECIIKFTDWVYTTNEIRLQNETYKMDSKNYKENSQWHLKDTYLSLKSETYEGAIFESILAVMSKLIIKFLWCISHGNTVVGNDRVH